MPHRPLLDAAPSTSFDEPFDMLAACHHRVERTLGLLELLLVHLDAQGCDASAQQAARDVLRYFDVAGPAHHEDEERHVFPVLAARGDPALDALVARLAAEHAEMAAQWQRLRVDLDQVVSSGWTATMAADMAMRSRAFAALYRAHIAVEERDAYPAAAPRVDASARAAMGREMAARRSVRWPP